MSWIDFVVCWVPKCTHVPLAAQVQLRQSPQHHRYVGRGGQAQARVPRERPLRHGQERRRDRALELVVAQVELGERRGELCPACGDAADEPLVAEVDTAEAGVE
jgi:hypothetical protein